MTNFKEHKTTESPEQDNFYLLQSNLSCSQTEANQQQEASVTACHQKSVHVNIAEVIHISKV